MTIYNTLSGSAIPSVRSVAEVNKRRDLFFVGDSITWGWGVDQSQSYPRLLQTAINSGLSYIDAGWVARNVSTDDWTSPTTTPAGPFNGGLPAGGTPKLIVNNVGQLMVGPYGSYLGDQTSTSGSPPFTMPGIQLIDTNSYIRMQCPSTFSATYLTAVVYVEGTASVQMTATDFSGNAVGSPQGITNNTYFRPVFSLGSSLTGCGIKISSISGGGPSDKVYVIALQPTNVYPTSNWLNVHVNARNSYAIEDYIALSIQLSAIHRTDYDGTQNVQPIFVLAVGTVSMYAGGLYNNRQVIPSVYQSQLNTLATNLQTTGSYPGQVILTIPPIPTAGSLLSGYTRNDYDKLIIELANTLGVKYVDLRPVLGPGDYLADGLHPNTTGHAKLSVAYREALRI